MKTALLVNHPTLWERVHHPLRIPTPTSRRFRIEMSQNPVNRLKKITVLNDRKEKLVGLLHDTGTKDVVVVCHGFAGGKEHKLVVDMCDALEKGGISAYRFDFSGNGESDGTWAYGNYLKEVEDIFAVVKHFNGENRIVSAIVGHSKGGNVVLLYASKYHDVHTVVNLSGRYDLKKGIAERLGEDFLEKIKKNGYIDVKCKKTGINPLTVSLFQAEKDLSASLTKVYRNVLYRVAEENLMDRLSTDMHEASLRNEKDCRVLTVHGSADEIIPVEDAYEFSKIIPNHRLHIIEGANHSFTEHQDELHQVVIDFIKSCMLQERE